MTRTERQKECVKQWLNHSGQATIVAATGFGKTRIGMDIIDLLLCKHKDVSILIVVPTILLKEQWEEELIKRNCFSNCCVEVVNSLIKNSWTCDLLIIDEVHKFPTNTFSTTFDCVDYKLILCLTATFERLDGKEKIVNQFAPVCDTVSFKEAEDNGWIAKCNNYKVLIDVDLKEYNYFNKQFNKYFSYLGNDFNLAMQCISDKECRKVCAKNLGLDEKAFMGILMGFIHTLHKRKKFVMSHPKKFEIAKKIVDARKDSKTIIFTATIADAKNFGKGYVLHSKQSRDKNLELLQKFNREEKGIIISAKCADTGVDIKGLNLGIITSVDSSKIRKTQRMGRVVRAEDNKIAEFFTLVIKGTIDETWANNSNVGDCIVINESQLEDVLNRKPIQVKQQEVFVDYENRF